jgi:hypothetical protein
MDRSGVGPYKYAGTLRRHARDPPVAVPRGPWDQQTINKYILKYSDALDILDDYSEDPR